VRLYLASTSPRRRDLLTAAGYEFICVEPGAEPVASGRPEALAIARARSKCVGAAVPPASPPCLVLGVDTVVDLDGEELGKPRDRDDARRMLERLSGRDHAVHTAHCLRLHPAGEMGERLTTARVHLRRLAPAEVASYLDSGDWRDKAGGYGIQSLAGPFCTLLEGDRGTVIGLSLPALRELVVGLGGVRPPGRAPRLP
jgi:septum formation protein